MPTKRHRVSRLSEAELDAGQLAFLFSEKLPPSAGLWPFNRWCWLLRGAEHDPYAVLPDGSPSPHTLWARFGEDAIARWHERHGDTPHPLLDVLGLPEIGRAHV